MSKPKNLFECTKHHTIFDDNQPCWSCVNEGERFKGSAADKLARELQYILEEIDCGNCSNCPACGFGTSVLKEYAREALKEYRGKE